MAFYKVVGRKPLTGEETYFWVTSRRDEAYRMKEYFEEKYGKDGWTISIIEEVDDE